MKYALFLIAIVLSVTTYAQLPTTRQYPSNTQLVQRIGTQPYTAVTPTYYHGSGTNAVVGKDTLTGVDTIELFWNFNNPYNTKFVVNVTPVTSTISGTIYFFCSPNGVDWYSVTGLTTVCTGCIGASQTLTSVSTSTRYMIDVGNTNMFYWKAVVANSNSGGSGAITGVGLYSGTGN
jgi:hypothetical protein